VADILLQPIFNPVGGYASYMVPAAFVLILQQTSSDFSAGGARTDGSLVKATLASASPAAVSMSRPSLRQAGGEEDQRFGLSRLL
jgi:ABC-2 type transport system permease protein